MFLDAVKPSPLEPTRLLNTADIEVGVPLMATCCELALFAVFFCWSYSVTPYLLPASSPQAAAPSASPSSASAASAASTSPSLSTSETLTGVAADPESRAAAGPSDAVLNEKQQGQQQQQRYHGGFCGLKAWLMMLNHMDMLKGFIFPFVYIEEAALVSSHILSLSLCPSFPSSPSTSLAILKEKTVDFVGETVANYTTMTKRTGRIHRPGSPTAKGQVALHVVLQAVELLGRSSEEGGHSC